MHPDYQSELYSPFLFHEDLFTPEYVHPLSTEELLQMHRKYSEYLDRLRSEEPRKRKDKSERRFWVTRTHDLRDALNTIAEELRSRKEGTS